MRKQIQRTAMLVGLLGLVGGCAAGVDGGGPGETTGEEQIDPSAVWMARPAPLGQPLPGPSARGPAAAAPFDPEADPLAFLGAPYRVGTLVTPTTTAPQAEEHITIDPTRSANLVAVITDFSVGGAPISKWAVSTDAGLSWRDDFIARSGGLPATGDGQTFAFEGDPVLAADRAGRVFMAHLYFNAGQNGSNANGLYVSVGSLRDPAGLTFTQAATHPVATDLDPATPVQEDKEWLAVDNSASAFSGHVYVSWTRFDAATNRILFSRSSNHGVSWSTPKEVNLRSHEGAVQGSQVAVGPAGEIYVSYQVFLAGNARKHYLTRSVDGGVTFSKPLPATPSFQDLTFASSYRKDSFPAMAVSPVNGDVYLVYPDQPGASSRIAFVRSSDGGLTFSAPTAVNDVAAGQRFMPAVTVDSTGVVHTSWFDTRNGGGGTDLYDIFATRTLDRGLSFAPNKRVTPASLNAAGNQFLGDYSGIAAGGGLAHPVWTRGGSAADGLQTARLR